MATVNSSAGDLVFGPAIARAATTQSALRSLGDLADTTGGSPVAAEWRGTATVSILGQLAVAGSAGSEKILLAACAVAKLRRSMAGLEAVFLSALLGVAPDSSALDTADSLWSSIDDPAGAGDLVPVLHPILGELCFLAREDTGSLTGSAVQAQVDQLCRTRPVAPGSGEDMVSFGSHLLVAACTVASAQIIAGRPDDSAYTSAAVQVIPAADRSDGLPHALLSGTALLVQACLIRGAVPPAATGPWRAIWPSTALLATDVPAAQALAHPFWNKSKLCAAWPATGPGLAGLLVRRGDVLVLPKMPRFDASGNVVQQGFYPPLTDGQPAPAAGTGWRQHPFVPDTPTDPTAPIIILGGPHHDPLTGQRTDALGHPIPAIPGRGFVGYGDTAALRTRLQATTRDGGLPATTSLDEVLQQLVETDYGLRVAGRPRTQS